MASQILTTKISLRNDTALNWTTTNPVLLKGELGIESDTTKIKIGDGATTWINLPYATVRPDDLSDLGAGDMMKATYDTNNNGIVDKAERLSSTRVISLTGDGTATLSFDGSADASAVLTLKNSGVTAGTYTKLTVNAKGIVTSATTLSATDIPSLTLSKITDAGTAASKNVGTASGNVPVLGSDGKLNASVLPAIAITNTFVVASQTEMLALNAQTGDIAIRTDVSKTFVLSEDTPSVLSAWIALETPDCAISSVNGQTGDVVLTTSNIDEGNNLYYTEARATANFKTHASSDLTDGTTILKSTDTFVLNCGNA